jgi:hypothetical protein
LEVSDIEDAGIRDVLQTPGAAYGAWSVLDTRLADLQFMPNRPSLNRLRFLHPDAPWRGDRLHAS